MKYFAAVVVLAAVALAQPAPDAAAETSRDTRAAIPVAYPGAYVAGAPVAYASHPAYVAGAPVAYAAQPAYKAAPYYAAPAVVAPHYGGAPIAYAAQPAYYTANAYKTVHV